MVALIWVALTTPLTTLPLLQLADRPGSGFRRFTSTLPYWGTATIVGLILVGLPIIGVMIGSAAMRRVSASWTPVRGGGFAKTAILLGVISAIGAMVVYISGLLAPAVL